MLLEVVIGLLLASAPETGSASPPVGKPEEKKVCRKQVETGSLVKGKKICYTAKQWQKIADASREDIERTTGMGSQSGQ